MEKLRKKVSGDKYRHKEGDYDLDLAYIRPNIIAMSLPGQSIAKVWRNPINQVVRFLNQKHTSRYLIFNLSGIKYNYAKFDYRVKDFAFPDLTAPPLSLLEKIVKAMDEWLKIPGNVAVIHCLAGRGRTGTVIASYLLYIGLFSKTDEAVSYFNEVRSREAKSLKLPSQIRFVRYYQRILDSKQTISPKRIYLSSITLQPVPKVLGPTGEFNLVVQIEDLNPPFIVLQRIKCPPALSSDSIIFADIQLELMGDIQIKFFHLQEDKFKFGKCVSKLGLDRHNIAQYPYVPLFRFSFNTSMEDQSMVLNIGDIDKPQKGPLQPTTVFPANFQVIVDISRPNTNSPPPAARSPPPVPSRDNRIYESISPTLSDSGKIYNSPPPAARTSTKTNLTKTTENPIEFNDPLPAIPTRSPKNPIEFNDPLPALPTRSPTPPPLIEMDKFRDEYLCFNSDQNAEKANGLVLDLLYGGSGEILDSRSPSPVQNNNPYNFSVDHFSKIIGNSNQTSPQFSYSNSYYNYNSFHRDYFNERTLPIPSNHYSPSVHVYHTFSANQTHSANQYRLASQYQSASQYRSSSEYRGDTIVSPGSNFPMNSYHVGSGSNGFVSSGSGGNNYNGLASPVTGMDGQGYPTLFYSNSSYQGF